MKILAIRIKNLASLEGTTEIDFTKEPLCSAGIFAITGATGAGKSTILDAICLALYARTPRYNLAKETGIKVLDINGNELRQGDIGGILRNGTADGFASIDFAGVDGHVHQATWRIRRARNKVHGELQADTVDLKDLTNNAIFPGKKTETLKEIERLVGLSFDQFTRSVMLAQGDFTAFLKAKEDEKSSLLEKLTGTTIYSEISKLIYEKSKAATVLLIELKKDVTRTNSLTEEELAIIVAQKDTFVNDIVARQKLVDNCNTEINWHEVATALLAQQTEAEYLLTAATANEAGSKERALLLNQIGAAQEIKSAISAKQENTKSIASQNVELVTQIKKRDTLAIQKNDTTNQLAQAEKELAVHKRTQEDALPLLDKAKNVDTKIEEKELLLTAAKQTLDDVVEQTKEQLKILSNSKLESNKLENTIAEINTWVAQNNARKPLAENIVLIGGKLLEGNKILFSLQQQESEVALHKHNLENENIAKAQIDKNLENRSKLLQAAQIALQEKQSKLKNIDFENLTAQKIEAEGKLDITKDAIVYWKQLYTNTQYLNVLEEKICTNKTNLQENIATLTAENSLLQEFTIKKQTTENVLNKARLAATESIEKLRLQLVLHEPCPVCGSVEHPYTVHNPQFDSVLASVENEHQINVNNFEKYLKSVSTIQQKCAGLEITIADIDKEIKANQHKVNEAIKKWQSNEVHKDGVLIVDDKKENWLNEKLKTCKENQEQLQQQIIKYNEDKRLVENVKEENEKLEKAVADLRNQQKDNQRNVQSLSEKIESLEIYLSANRIALEAVEEELNPYFPNALWKENWRKNQAPFIKKLTDFAAEWKANIEILDNSNLKYNILSANRRGMEEKLEFIKNDEIGKHSLFNTLTNDIGLLKTERKHIFEGVDVKTIEKKLKSEVDNGEEKLKTIHKLNFEHAEELAKADTQKEMLINSIAILQTGVEQSNLVIVQWVEAYNHSHTPKITEENVIELLKYTYDWVAKERSTVKAIADEFNTATTIVSERKKNYSQHLLKQLSNNTLEQLLEQLHVHKQELNKVSEEKTKLELQLSQDAVNKLEINDLQNSIEAATAVAENWSKLNDMIGAADGKKFRQIAQEYTLDLLLTFSNYQLKILSNRYLLERVAGTLGLQILDLDMGNEVRSVYSLSGGESFLVSLALALGLSSLSSNLMKVESLFIDEGFGSLDPQTLNVAMDALERLQNQGRKVGVISHVQEMTERIPAQIKVVKMANGKSKVEVVS